LIVGVTAGVVSGSQAASCVTDTISRITEMIIRVLICIPNL
jgi:hypothetical protein